MNEEWDGYSSIDCEECGQTLGYGNGDLNCLGALCSSCYNNREEEDDET